MRLSVVIPTLDRPDALPRALAALEAQTLAASEFEVIVAEDARNETPVDTGGRQLRLRRVQASTPGASAARNAGWRAAEAPLVMFLGDDILPDAGTLARHVGLHDRDAGDDVGVLGHVRWADELPRTAFMTWLDDGIQFAYPTIAGTEAGPGHLYTANLSLKRAALERVGGFDEESFPFLYEDIDLGLRLFAGGFRLIYDPGAGAQHVHRPRLEDWKRRMAAQARAERAWIARHPGERPYFHDRFAAALQRPRRPELPARLIRWVPKDAPVVGRWLWSYAEAYYGRELAGPFMESWRAPD